MEKKLTKWVIKIIDSRQRLTQRHIRSKAMQLMEQDGENNSYFRASKGWI
jgi:hypothetical protein